MTFGTSHFVSLADAIEPVPAGFDEVSRERFFALLKEAAAIDPMPNNDHPYFTFWEAQKGPRRVWGWSAPGWRSPHGTPHRYAVKAGAV